MAEGIMRRLLPEDWKDRIRVASAGTHAAEGLPPSEMAHALSLERGIDIAGHRSRPLGREMIEAASLILAMERRHLERVRELAGGAEAFLVTEYPARDDPGVEIADPVGLGREAYESVFDVLKREISRIVDYMTDK